MKTATGTTLITHGQLIDGTGALPIADAALVIRDGRIAYAGPTADISVLENPQRFLAVMQGGVIKAGQLAKPFPTVVKREK